LFGSNCLPRVFGDITLTNLSLIGVENYLFSPGGSAETLKILEFRLSFFPESFY